MAVNANITWDANGCVADLADVQFKDHQHWQHTQAVFTQMVVDPNITWTVAWGNDNDPSTLSPFGCPEALCSNFNPDRHTAYLWRADIGRAPYRKCGFLGALFRLSGHYSTLSAMISHELISHGDALLTGWPSHAYSEFFTGENEYHAAHGEPNACPDSEKF